ncbi:hypothetical protein GCK32_001778 [Trichostrongylus colubriformis]|uniref:Uncharacterized protein n=1 Tax=Trichostrongylus colubriformis TaxID=6319 RepID=A0AAN8ITL2_TRICO
MLFRTHNSYTLPKLHIDDRCHTPSLLDPDTLSVRDQQIRLYCQTVVALIHDLHTKSPKSTARLQRHVQRVLGIETQIDLTKDDSKSNFEHNVQLFICVVDHRLRSLAIDSPDRYQSIANKLQLILLESGSAKTGHATTVKSLRKTLSKLL